MTAHTSLIAAGRTAAACIALALVAGQSHAQSTPPVEPAKPAEPKPADPVPSLDELLGTKPQPPAGKPPEAGPVPPPESPDAESIDPTRENLDRLLRGEEIGEAFTEAVNLMDTAARRLEGSGDASLTTQRVQEDVIRRLDQLLASLQRRQSQSSSSSSSSSQSQDQQAQRNQPNQRKPSKAGRGQSQQAQSGQGERSDLGPARQDGPLKPNLDAARAAWGSLPERVRDMLLQGSSDRFSSRYQGLTEAYYRRLAEEKK
jgi:hypothetical protein